MLIIWFSANSISANGISANNISANDISANDVSGNDISANDSTNDCANPAVIISPEMIAIYITRVLLFGIIVCIVIVLLVILLLSCTRCTIYFARAHSNTNTNL